MGDDLGPRLAGSIRTSCEPSTDTNLLEDRKVAPVPGPMPRMSEWLQEEPMKRVLILCTGNSCRSQMAEALWNQLGQGEWLAESAGSRPAGFVHPLAIRAIAERGLDLSTHTSKSLDSFRDQTFDLVVTVCDHAKESCPWFAGGTETQHWPFADPADATGTEEQQLDVFRRVRDEIEATIEEYLRTGQDRSSKSGTAG